MADFGQADFGPNWCFSPLAQPSFHSLGRGARGTGREGWLPNPERRGPRRWGVQNFALFFSLSRPYLVLFVSLWVSPRGILVVFEVPGPSNVHVSALGLPAARRGWEHVAASVVEERAREAMFTKVSDQVKALVRSQSGPPGPELPSQQGQLAGKRPSLPICSDFVSQTSSAASPRGPCMPTWPSPQLLRKPSCCMSSCWGAEPSGFLVGARSRTHLQRGWGRVRTNAFFRDLDVPEANAGDGRRLEVVVDGLPLFGGGRHHVGVHVAR